MKQVKLGGYPAKQCARRTHNQYAPGTPEKLPLPLELRARMDAGRIFEAEVVDEFRRRYGGSSQLLILDDANDPAEWPANQRRTVEAMNARVPVIVNGRLPDINGRVGAPDVLIQHGGGYLPVDVKNHQTLNPSKDPDSPRARKKVDVSTLTEPDQQKTCRGYGNNAAKWQDDVMQLAHYTRMLQELGFHPAGGPDIGGIIGSSDLTPLLGDRHGIVWYDLDVQAIETYSATGAGNRANRSPLQRYDHEFAFRVTVAEAAQSGRTIVQPFRIKECAECEWYPYCTEAVGPRDASFTIEHGHLNVREWQYLYRNCGTGETLSVDQLAAVDTAVHADAFRVQSVGTTKPEDRLNAVVRRARMTCAGIDFEPRQHGRVQIPEAGIEVDFDIEWDVDQRIYQWGLRVRDGQDDSTARYAPVVSFDPLDEAAEAALAEEFAARIRNLRAEADRDGKSLAIYHWHTPETQRTRRFPAVAAVLDGLTVDLLKWFNAHYFARTSSSLKEIAPLLGFHWPVEEAGGAMSQVKVEEARGTGPDAEEARRWCLQYNESDVAAQAWIRDRLRAFGV
ncbi:MAG TPA: ribonuclease H-like domain-containing protein [Mycobacterium sp.]|nr:ribonuclease H-like domain-containing protein [Mycobacterium sp.]